MGGLVFKTKWNYIFLSTIMVLSYQNCGEDKSFTRAITDPSTTAQSCHDELKEITTPVKLLFVVDISGSNNIHNGSSDPGKIIREPLALNWQPSTSIFTDILDFLASFICALVVSATSFANLAKNTARFLALSF